MCIRDRFDTKDILLESAYFLPSSIRKTARELNINTDAKYNSETINGTIIEHYLFESGDQGVSVEHYKVNGGDHVWFDIQYQGNVTATLIWDFLSKFDINGLID